MEVTAKRPWKKQRSPTIGRILWMLGNCFIIIGLYTLLYVGGIYAQAAYNIEAARGDSELPMIAAGPVSVPMNAAIPVGEEVAAAPTPTASVALVASLVDSEAGEPAPEEATPVPTSTAPATVETAEPAPVLQQADGAIVSSVPRSTDQPADGSLVSRVAIPSLDIDAKVIEVGWEVQEQNGQQMAVWQVAEYAVGHHQGSANPGEGSNVVLAGHVGGYGKVFKDLFYIQPGAEVVVYIGEQQHRYVIEERLVLNEVGVPPQQRAANAQYIEPTNEETLTLVTCWPASGPDKFSQRIVVRAAPLTPPVEESSQQSVEQNDVGKPGRTSR